MTTHADLRRIKRLNEQIRRERLEDSQGPTLCPKCNTATERAVYCGVKVCPYCGHHIGISRCYCGWSASGGDERRELEEMGETIDPENY